MAQRLCFNERAQIEAMASAGHGTAEIAHRFGRHCSTIWWELRRNSGAGAYRARAVHAAAGGQAARPKAAKLAVDAHLARAVSQRLDQRWLPHAISADLRTPSSR